MITKMKFRRQQQKNNRSARRANKSKSRNSRRRSRTLRGGLIYSLEGLMEKNDPRTTFLLDTGLIEMDSEGVYQPTQALVTFLNTDIQNMRNYNYMELMTNNTTYTLYKEPLPTVRPPMKLQIMQNSSSANYGDPIPVNVY